MNTISKIKNKRRATILALVLLSFTFGGSIFAITATPQSTEPTFENLCNVVLNEIPTTDSGMMIWYLGQNQIFYRNPLETSSISLVGIFDGNIENCAGTLKAYTEAYGDNETDPTGAWTAVKTSNSDNVCYSNTLANCLISGIYFNYISFSLASDVTVVTADKDDLTDDSIKGANLDLSNISVALATLPLSGLNGSSISWESDDVSVLSNDGQTVNRPAFGDEDVNVTLTATITKGLAIETKAFVLSILETPASTIATITSVAYFVNNGASIIANVPLGTAKKFFLVSLVRDEVNQIWDETAIDNPVVTGNTLIVTAQDGSTTKTYTITVLAANQTIPDSNGAATVNSTTPQVVITNPTQAVNITISDGTTNPTINVSSFIIDGIGTLPAITITSANANNTNIAIPASTTVSSTDSFWNGIIAAPTVTTVILPTIKGETTTLSMAIEVGFTGTKLSFDKAVRILLPGQAGKRAGYIRTGTTFTEITNICVADNQVAGDAITTNGDCKTSIGSDLVIWTKHFTIFATYTQTPDSTILPQATPTQASSGGGSGIGEYINGPLANSGYIVAGATTAPISTPLATPASKVKVLPKIIKVSLALSPTVTPNQPAILTFQPLLQQATIIGTIGQKITLGPIKIWAFISQVLGRMI